MTLHRGSREIRILFLGRGHTAGDVVVYLPKERIVATGDLLVEGTSYMGDAFFTEWIADHRGAEGSWTSTRCSRATATRSEARPSSITGRRTCATSGRRRRSSTTPSTPWEEAAKLVDLRGNAVNYPPIRTAGIVRRTTACAAPTRLSTAR